MTTLLVVLGIGALAAGLKWRQQAKAVIKWLWNVTLLALAICVLVLAVLLLMGVVVLLMGAVAMLMGVVALGMCIIAVYLPVIVVALLIWAISRKRTAFDVLVKRPAAWLSNGLEVLFGSFESLFDWIESGMDIVEKVMDRCFESECIEIVISPITKAARAIWPSR